MPVFYNFTQDGLTYSFDDIFVPADFFREGNLWTWGSATSLQLGDGSTTGNRSTPITTFAGGANWKSVQDSFNTSTAAAIKTDGTLWIWGSQFNGQLGINNTGNRSTPVTTFAGGTNWKQITFGSAHAVAIKTDGTLWTWGFGGRLGNGTTTGNISTPVTTFAGGTNWRQVSCGDAHTVAIKTDGTLWAWGSGGQGKLGNGLVSAVAVISTPITTFAGGTNWRQVACSNNMTAAIKTDGTLWVWGDAANSLLGNGLTTGSISTPITTFAGGTNWKQVSSGGNHTAAIKTDGTLWTWGSGANAIGNGSFPTSTPVTTFAGGNNWKQVSCANAIATAAIKADGTLWTWGAGNNGILGERSTYGTKSTPVTTFAGGTNWRQVGSSGNGFAALTYDDPVI
jgi:alpha-tubulin suppressor-like RCC1 family protein